MAKDIRNSHTATVAPRAEVKSKEAFSGQYDVVSGVPMQTNLEREQEYRRFLKEKQTLQRHA